MVQYEDQEIEIDSPYSLSRFHQFYTDVCVCVCVFHYHNQDTECSITTENLHDPFAPSHS